MSTLETSNRSSWLILRKLGKACGPALELRRDEGAVTAQSLAVRMR